ncbi:MAG: ATP-binding cassette domain-containing protein [Candidatus Hinthialibacter antarcticus]|nr:ATP-binding cassette domain-containing protein [Candidatus Hinthialibacter antarcticus]
MICVENLCVKLGQFQINDVSFEIPQGQYGVLMGKTGCGKTTILEAICGLKPVQSGKITIQGRDVTHEKPAMRGIGLVPQDGSLFSTMSVYEHLAFALQIRKRPQDIIKQRVEELSELLGITHLLSRSIHGLSGGERQRTALGRALAYNPPILCLDEPLSALDDDTRDEMCVLLKDVQRHTKATFLHITHSREEAYFLANIILRIEDGIVTRPHRSAKPTKSAISPETERAAS